MRRNPKMLTKVHMILLGSLVHLLPLPPSDSTVRFGALWRGGTFNPRPANERYFTKRLHCPYSTPALISSPLLVLTCLDATFEGG